MESWMVVIVGVFLALVACFLAVGFWQLIQLEVLLRKLRESRNGKDET